jgi:hypothetical protein
MSDIRTPHPSSNVPYRAPQPSGRISAQVQRLDVAPTGTAHGSSLDGWQQRIPPQRLASYELSQTVVRVRSAPMLRGSHEAHTPYLAKGQPPWVWHRLQQTHVLIGGILQAVNAAQRHAQEIRVWVSLERPPGGEALLHGAESLAQQLQCLFRAAYLHRFALAQQSAHTAANLGLAYGAETTGLSDANTSRCAEAKKGLIESWRQDVYAKTARSPQT